MAALLKRNGFTLAQTVQRLSTTDHEIGLPTQFTTQVPGKGHDRQPMDVRDENTIGAMVNATTVSSSVLDQIVLPPAITPRFASCHVGWLRPVPTIQRNHALSKAVAGYCQMCPRWAWSNESFHAARTS